LHNNHRRIWRTDIRVMILDKARLYEMSEGKLLLTKKQQKLTKTLKKTVHVGTD